jgi:hypothetical protein
VIEINKIVSLANETNASSCRIGSEGNYVHLITFFYMLMRFHSFKVCANVTVYTFVTINF